MHQLICNFFDDLHLQIIQNISPKASVENSSAQWAIFLIVCCPHVWNMLVQVKSYVK